MQRECSIFLNCEKDAKERTPATSTSAGSLFGLGAFFVYLGNDCKFYFFKGCCLLSPNSDLKVLVVLDTSKY